MAGDHRARRLTGVIEGTARLFNLVAGAALVAMLLHVNLDVIGRTLLGMPIPMATEVVSHYYMVAVVFLPLAAVALAGGHITVELLGQSLTGVARRLLALFATCAAIVYFAAMTWHTGRTAIDKYEIGEYVIAQTTLTIWPTRFLVPLGCGLLVLVYLVIVFRGDPEPPHEGSS